MSEILSFYADLKKGDLEEIRRWYNENNPRIEPNTPSRDDGKPLPLMVAIEFGHAHIIPYLLSQGEDPRFLDEQENSAWKAVAETNNTCMARALILAGANPDLPDRDDKRAWDYIKDKPQLRIVFEESVRERLKEVKDSPPKAE